MHRDEDDPPAVARQKRRAPDRPHGKRKKPAERRSPWLLIGLLGGGGLLIVLGVVAGLLLLGSGDGGRAGGDPGDALDISRDPIRPKSGQSTGQFIAGMSFLPEVPKVEWKVTPDPVKPADGLRSVFAWSETDSTRQPLALLFARPDVARAAVLMPDPDPRNWRPGMLAVGAEGQAVLMPAPNFGTWVQYDLRSVDPRQRVALGSMAPTPDDPAPPGADPPARFLADLSPSGDRLAVQQWRFNPPRVHVWSNTGEHVAKLKPAEKNLAADWLGHIDDDRLLILSDGQLSLRELPSGRVAYTVAAQLRPPVVLSAGRKWAAAFDGQAFVWVRTADGQVCGKTPVPGVREKRGDATDHVSAAVSLDGTRFVVSRSATSPMGHTRCLAVWDLATGELKETWDALVPNGLAHHVQWCGPRQLLLGSSRVVDLDLLRDVWWYWDRNSAIVATDTPDGRFWYVPGCNLPYRPGEIDLVMPHLKDSKFQEQVRRTGLVLAAWTVPHAEARRRLDAHRASRALAGLSVRIVVDEEDRAFRRAAGERIADALAAVGCRVSPTEAGIARLTLGPIESGRVERRAAAAGPAIAELVPGKIMKAKLEVLDGSRTPRWQVATEVTLPDVDGASVDVVRERMLQQLGRMIGKGESQIAGTEGLPNIHDVSSERGIDGVPDQPASDQRK